MSDQPTKEEQLAVMPDRLNKEEMYAKYGPYVSENVFRQWQGKAPKVQAPYEQTIFPGIPDDMQDKFLVASLRRTPEQNAKDLEILGYYRELGTRPQYQPNNLAASGAATTMGNLGALNLVSGNRMNDARLSRQAAASVIEFNLKNDPAEYAKYAEARANIGEAARYYGAPEELIQLAATNYTYNAYFNEFNDGEYGKVTLGYLASPIGKAATTDDLKRLREIAASQDEDISHVVYDSYWFSDIYNMRKDMVERLEAANKDEPDSQAMRELYELAQIYNQFISDKSMGGQMLAGLYSWGVFLPQDVASVLEEENYGYTSTHQQFLLDRLNDEYVVDRGSVQQALGGAKMLDALNLEANRREEMDKYLAIAARTGKSYNQVVAENKKNFDGKLMIRNAITIANLATAPAGKFVSTLPSISKLATTKAGELLARGAAEVGGDAVINAAANAPLEGALSAYDYQLAKANGLPTDYDSVATAFAIGMTKNFLENVLTGTAIGATVLTPDVYHYLRSGPEVARVQKTIDEAKIEQGISTMETAPEATAISIQNTLKQQGYQEKNVYFYPEDLEMLLNDETFDTDALSQEQYDFLFKDLKKREDAGLMVVVSREQLAQKFKDTPLMDVLTGIGLDRVTATSKAQREQMGKSLEAELDERAKKNPEIALTSAAELKAAKKVAYHEVQEQTVSMLHNEVAALALKDISNADITLGAREVTGVFMTVMDENNIPLADVVNLFKEYKPKFKLRQSVLNVESGHADDKVRGTYDPETHTIELSANANLGTLMHELLHHYIEFTMAVADKYKDNRTAQSFKYQLLRGFINEDPNILDKDWKAIDPALRERIQESAAHNYITARVARTFSIDDYTAKNKLDEEGNKTGRTFAPLRRLDRAIAASWADYWGIDIRGMSDEQMRAAIQSALPRAQQAFEADYGYTYQPETLKLFSAMIDSAATNFVDEHRISTMYPMHNKGLSFPGASKKDMDKLERTLELVSDEANSEIYYRISSAGREEIKNMDKIYQMRKKDIERNPEYKAMLKEREVVKRDFEDAKANADKIEGAISEQKRAVNELIARRDATNDAAYRKERGDLKRRVTGLNKRIDTNTQKVGELTTQQVANQAELELARVTNATNKETYELAKQTVASQEEILAKAHELHEQYIKQREELTKRVAEGTATKEELADIRRAAKNQGDVVRRARNRLADLQDREKAARQANEKSALAEAKLIEQGHKLQAQLDKLTQDTDALAQELNEKQAALSVDPVGDMAEQIKQLKQDIKDGGAKLKEARKGVKEAERKVKAFERRYKEVENRWSEELASLDNMYGDAQAQMAAYRKQAAADLDDEKHPAGEKYQQAKFYKEQLEGKPEDDPTWNEARELFQCRDNEELKAYLEAETDRDKLIENLAADYYQHTQRLSMSQEQLDEIVVKRAGKINRIILDFLEGKLSKSARDARNLRRKTAMEMRNQAGLERFGNTSPQAFMTRAEAARSRAQRIPLNPGKYNGNYTAMLMDMYQQYLIADFYDQIALSSMRMKTTLQKEINMALRKLNAKGVNSRIDGDYVMAAKAILGHIGIIKSDTPAIILRQIKENFPEHWERVKGFFEDTDKLNLQYYRQMQMTDLKEVLDLVNVIIHNGEEVVAMRNAEIIKHNAVTAEEMNASLDELFEERPELAKALAESKASNAPDRSQLTGLQKAKALWQNFKNRTMTVQSGCEMLDRKTGGVFTREIYNPVADANNNYIIEDRKLAERLQPAFEKVRPQFDPRSAESKELKLNEPITWIDRDGNKINIVASPDGNIRKALAPYLLHMGSESNFTAMCNNLNIDPDVMVKNINDLAKRGVITPELMDYVQAYWDAYKPIGVATQEAYNKINGAHYKPIEGRPIEMFGKTYAGGYAPLIRKRNQFLNPNATLSEQMADASHDLPPSFDPGFAKERKESSTLPLDFSHDAMLNAMSRQLRYAHIYPALHRVSVFMKAYPEIMHKANTAIPGFVDDVIIPWMRGVANQSSSDIKTNPGVDALARAGARVNQSIMAGNISNAAQQITGLIVATAKVGVGSLLHATFSPMTRQDILELSTYMRTRLEDNKKSMSILRRDLRSYTKTSRAKNWLDDNSYILQTTIQNWVDRIVWSAKYQEEIGKGVAPSDAVKSADQAVRMTQGSFNIADSSAFDRDPISKILIPFMNYFQAMANLWRARLGQMNRGVESKVHRVFNGILLATQIMIIPSLVSFAIAQTIKGFWADADEEDAWQFMEDATASAATGVLSGIHPFAGQVATIAYNMFQDKPTPSSLINAPLATLIPSAMRSSAKIYDAVVNGDNNLSSYDAMNVLHVFNAMGFFPALGSAAASRGLAVASMTVGDAEVDSGFDAVRAAVTGTLSEAQRGNR